MNLNHETWLKSRRVEYIKQWVPGVKPIILTHVGSNNFVREVYRPDLYSHRVTLAGSNGEDKTGADRVTYDIAGPLCFQVLLNLGTTRSRPKRPAAEIGGLNYGLIGLIVSLLED